MKRSLSDKWSQKNKESDRLEISILNENPVYFGYDIKNIQIVFYSDITAENTNKR
jgi:hypothetical protein